MDNKAAIKEMAYLYDKIKDIRSKVAIDAGIKALEQEPKLLQALEQEKGAYNALVKNIQCADAISRQAVDDAIYDYSRSCDVNYGQIMEYIDKIPPVTAEPKTGHWIEHPKNIYAHLVCDRCLSNAPYDCRTNYCPNCGAKMQEVEE